MKPGDAEWKKAVTAAVAGSTRAQGVPLRVEDSTALDAIARVLTTAGARAGAFSDPEASRLTAPHGEVA